eukprot:1260662-Amphidinium_carterae.1
MKHLNRTYTWGKDSITWEADERHSRLLIQAMGLEGKEASKVTTPLVREKWNEWDESEDGDGEYFLDDEMKSRYQSLTMRLGYLAQDRIDLQRVVRELAKGMANPQGRHWGMLKRAVRYLRHVPTVTQEISRQDFFKCLHVSVDSDHGGDVRTRKSTTGVVIGLGSCYLRSICRGQAVISLSSAEAEFYGLVTATSEALGEQSLLRDWGISVNIKVWMDATSGAAIGSRRGLGKTKHIHTSFLWVQNLITQGRVNIGKVHTSQNPADILTKPVTWQQLSGALKTLGLKTV